MVRLMRASLLALHAGGDVDLAPGGFFGDLELHQLVRSETEARYMERAWGVMLARFRDRVRAALPLVVDESSQPELL